MSTHFGLAVLFLLWAVVYAHGQTSGCMPTTCQCIDARYCK